MRANIPTVLAAIASCWAAMLGGCGGDARVDLAAADALQSIAASMELALNEYHTDTVGGDDARESALVAALLERVQRDASNETQLEEHGAAFERALRKIRYDRDVELQRYHAAMDNAALLREVAADLRRLAVASLTLQDEMRRYVYDILESQAADKFAGRTKR